MEIKISRTDAALNDPEAVDKLPRIVVEQLAIREAPTRNEPRFGQIWHEETQLEFWISSDGARVCCLTVSGLAKKQAVQVRAKWQQLHDDVGITPILDEKILAQVMRQVTGGNVRIAP